MQRRGWRTRRTAARGLAMIVLGVSLAAAVGCGRGGPRIVPVSGRVLMDGKPLTGRRGFVRVVPAKGRAATASIDPATGRFMLSTFTSGDGCLEGTHPAAVIVNTTVGGSRLVWLIPEKYGDEATSGLTVAVDGPTQDLEFSLTGGLEQAPTQADVEVEMPEYGL